MRCTLSIEFPIDAMFFDLVPRVYRRVASDFQDHARKRAYRPACMHLAAYAGDEKVIAILLQSLFLRTQPRYARWEA